LITLLSAGLPAFVSIKHQHYPTLWPWSLPTLETVGFRGRTGEDAEALVE
jgi:hypothetical protein